MTTAAMTPDVVAVRPLRDYCLEADFASGERRRFDMKPYLTFPAFAPLSENNLFMRAHVSHGTVAWTDDIDLSPDTLYLRGTRIPEHGDELMKDRELCKQHPQPVDITPWSERAMISDSEKWLGAFSLSFLFSPKEVTP